MEGKRRETKGQHLRNSKTRTRSQRDVVMLKMNRSEETEDLETQRREERDNKGEAAVNVISRHSSGS